MELGNMVLVNLAVMEDLCGNFNRGSLMSGNAGTIIARRLAGEMRVSAQAECCCTSTEATNLDQT